MWVGKGMRTGDNVLFFQQFFSTIAPISIPNIMLTQSQYTIYKTYIASWILGEIINK